MLITDAQVHIWALPTPGRPWALPPAAPPHRPQPFSKDDLLREMDAAGVARAVLVPPSWEGERNDLALEAARLHPARFAVMGRLKPDLPDAREQLAAWRQAPGMLGLRFTFARPHLQAPLNEGRLDWVWAAAEKAGLPVMMIVTPFQLTHVDRIAGRHPGLRLVMDHLALHQHKKDAEAFADLDKLLALAKRDNVAVKATAIPGYASDPWPYRRLHPYLKRVYDAFGPRRMFWGTDLTRIPCTYKQAIDVFTREIPWLSAEDQEWIMGRGISEWLGWQMP